jgi:outer membrane protein assembly factor BamB
MLKTRLTVIACLLVFGPRLWAEPWAHWRGSTGNGTAASATPPTEWSSTKNVRWKVAIAGRGSGSPVIWEDQVFVVTAVPDAEVTGVSSPSPTASGRSSRRQSEAGSGRLPRLQFMLLSIDRHSGKLRWQQVATVATPHQETHSTNGFASASPCTDGQHVYAHFGSRGLYCYTMDGQLVWKRDDFDPMNTRSSFGEGSSPTLEGDKILVPWDHEGPSYLYALNKLTGETIWRAERDEPTCWATPLVVEHAGRKQVVMNGQTCARGYDLETGQELWRCPGQTERPVASAVAGNGLVYVGSGFRGSFLGAFRLDGKGDIAGTSHVAWTINRDTPDIASPLLSQGRLYFYKGKSGLLSCLDAATGRPYYTASRIPGVESTYASPIAAGGHVYLTDRNGTTVVIEDAEELKIVATNSVGETVDATPAAVDSELFIRGENHLFCIAAGTP